ncbi:hypothetical protein [Mesorhizobium loti]|uniref:hypothetical protein n=1 Tax=Rhizobium loti TaxID=381 RepID=UPI003D7C2903
MRPHLDRFGISNSFCIPYPVLSHLGHALRNQFEVLQKQAWRLSRLLSRTIPLRSAEPRPAVSRV